MAENGKYDLVLFQPPDTRSAQPKMYFPLSLFYLAASVESYKVKILDFRQAIGDIPPARFYGMSVATPQIGIAKELSCRLPGIRIIGGPHPSLLPED